VHQVGNQYIVFRHRLYVWLLILFREAFVVFWCFLPIQNIFWSNNQTLSSALIIL